MARIRSMKPESVGGRLRLAIESADCRWDHRFFAYVVPPLGSVLYRLFDDSGQLLYVGISRNPVQRWRKHRIKKAWWAEVVRIECEIFATGHLALVAEVVAIRAESPRHNSRSAVV